MTDTMVGLIGVVILVVLILLRMPIGFAMAIVGFAGLAVIVDIDGAFTGLALTPFRTVARYALAVLPFFLLMGSIASAGEISRDLYIAAYKWIGQVRGGLAMATVVACGGFAAICGSSTATAAAMGRVALPEM